MLIALVLAAGAAAPNLPGLDALYPKLDSLYLDLHQSPELSMKEEKTAAKMAAQLVMCTSWPQACITGTVLPDGSVAVTLLA